jgi:LysM repeat protein
MYNINPKELASFNHLHFATGLHIGQLLKIPLSKNNFTQVKNASSAVALVPVYHTVVAGETLYRLGVNYNKVPLSSLKKWNHLSSDALTVGKPMVVGFLKVDKNQSPLANQAADNVAVTTISQPAAPDVTPEKKAAPIIPAQKETEPEPQKPSPAPVNNPVVTITPTNNTSVENNNSTGFFKNLYEQQSAGNPAINKNGSAGIFKSTSGWQDGKYYCFSNDAAAGTVLKITNDATGKSVYAKVLDVIPDISQNDGLLIVISNAAADVLGAGNNNFKCNVSFSKK